MTPLSKPVRRSLMTPQGKQLVVTMSPEGLYVREKLRRTSYLLPWGAAYIRAALLHAERERADKIARRKARQASR